MNNRKRLQHSFLLSMLCEPMLVAPCCCLMNEQHLLVLDIPAWGAAAPAAVAPGEAIDRFLSNLVPEAMNVYFSSQHHPAHCTPLKEQWYGAKYSVEPLCQASVALQASAKAADKRQVLVPGTGRAMSTLIHHMVHPCHVCRTWYSACKRV